ncbi:MAG TPA: primase alpha helix C-terminal domain-containing protein, partial [Nitrososphaeraceae archaeon]|nr:primase alpha helix C-terminal domain-containing protein [Nitrososphaeraceae archaeon]
GFDFDKELGIKEFCKAVIGANTSYIDEIKQKIIVEQNAKDPFSLHIYFYSEIPFIDKSPDSILGIEIKSNGKGLMCATPSYHSETDSIWQIKGTDSPIILKSEEALKLMSNINDICGKYNISYLKIGKDASTSSSSIYLTPLIKQMINSLEINPDIIIQEGVRHDTLLSIANSVLIKHSHKISKENLKDFFTKVNDILCSPPLPQNEVTSIWQSALEFSQKVVQDFTIINNDEADHNNYNKPIIVSLEIGEELEYIVQSFVKDNQQNNLILEFNHKYPQTKIHVPTTGPKKWLDFRKDFKKILEEYEVKEEDIKLVIKTLDSNYDLIINKNERGGDGGDGGDRSAGGTIADILVKLAMENSSLFKDEFDTPYALVKINDHFEVMAIDGSKFKKYLSKLYYDNNDNKSANSEGINNAKMTLGANAVFKSQTIPLHLRIAWSNPETKDSIYYDMTDEKSRCIKITKGESWKIVENQIEVLFKRFGHQSPQLEPLHDYDSKILDKFVDSLNIKNETDKILIKVWIVSLLIPVISIPMVLPFGPEGSAKSTLQKKIKLLIDPSSLDLLSIYNDKTQFIQQLSHNFLCFYDNVRYEPPWLSDETCRAITGGAFSKRELFTNDEDIPYRYKKRMSFSGINIIFKEADALDRSIRIELEKLDPKKKIPDEKIDSELKQQTPQLLGYIFDIVAKALEIKDTVSLEELPRMADFAVWGEAIARAMGYKPFEFLNAYFENIGEQKIEIIEANPFAEAISKFINYEMMSWISSPKNFIRFLREFADNNDIDSKFFPKSSQAISNNLRKIKGSLLEGLDIEIIVERITSGKGNRKLKNTTIVKIRKRSPPAPLAPLNENDEGNVGDSGGDHLNGAVEVSTETITSPLGDNQSRAQITSYKSESGAGGAGGDVFRSFKDDMKKNFLFQCHYCDSKFSSEKDLLKHSINIHPGKPAQPDKTITRLEKEKTNDHLF